MLIYDQHSRLLRHAKLIREVLKHQLVRSEPQATVSGTEELITISLDKRIEVRFLEKQTVPRKADLEAPLP